MEVKWMSRDFDTCYVAFWTEKPDLNGRVFEGDGFVGDACNGCVPNPPEPGTCVPVESFKPIEVTVKQEPRYWLVREHGNAFSVLAASESPKFTDDRLLLPGNSRFLMHGLSEEAATLIHRNHRLTLPGQCIEIPPR